MDNDLNQTPQQEVTEPIVQPQSTRTSVAQPLDVQPQPTIQPVKNNKKSKILLIFLIILIVLILVGVAAFYFIKQKDNSVIVAEPSTTPIPTLQPSQPEVTDTECADFSEMLSSCTEYTCEFTHPLTGEVMTRVIFGLTDSICKYSEEMPNSGQMDCNYTESMRKAVAQAYNDMMKKRSSYLVSVSGNLAEDTYEVESTYTVDGKTITNPGQEALDSGQCVISGY